MRGTAGHGRRSLGVPRISGQTGRIFHLFLQEAKASQQRHDQGQLGCTGDAGGGSGLAQPLCCGFWELLCSHTGCRLPVLPTSAFALGVSPTPCQAGLRFHLLPRYNEQADALFNLRD